MKNRSFRNPMVALLAALALVLAACGDDDAESVADAADDAETAAEDAAEDAIDAGLGGDCGFLGKIAGTGFDESLDPSAALTDPDAGDVYGALAEQFREVAEAAPDEIEDALRTMADGFDEFGEAFEGVDFSDPASMDPEKLEGLGEGFGAEFEKAADEVEGWFTENCAAEG